MNSQPFTVKKNDICTLSCGFVLGGNAIKTRPVSLWRTRSKKLEAKASGGRDEAVVEILKIEFGFSHTHTHIHQNPHQRHRWEIFAANIYFTLFCDNKGWSGRLLDLKVDHTCLYIFPLSGA